jgi:hypothetical protein
MIKTQIVYLIYRKKNNTFMEDIKDFGQFLNNNTKLEIIEPEIIENTFKDLIIESNIKNQEQEIVEDVKDIHIESNTGLYKIFRDKEENFTCEIEVDGANLENTNVRLMFETKDWNIFIDGTIDSNGNVKIPIKKMSIFNEGVKGSIRMEVIADNTLFIPWEDEFEVKMSKKVTLKFNENKEVKQNSGVNVRMK